MSSLAKRMISVSGKESLAGMMGASNYGDKKVICQTDVPALNILLGGDLDGGITCGVTQIVGDSRTFKTNIAVEVVSAYLEHDEEAICVMFDCEFGAMKAFENRCPHLISRIVHVPFEDLEDLKFQFTKMLESIKRGEKVIFFIDSISQVASKKEIQNALVSNEAADLTRAREMNSFFRIVTPKLNIRNIPLFAINSYYDDTTSQYAEPIIKGGKQSFLSSDSVWLVSRSQDKDDATKELLGWNFNYSVMKSRFCKEKSKITIHVTYKGGIDPLSSMVELAKESGYLLVPTQGYYQFNSALINGATDRKYRMKEIMADPDLFKPILASKAFRDYVRQKYSLSEMSLGVKSTEETVDQETGEVN